MAHNMCAEKGGNVVIILVQKKEGKENENKCHYGGWFWTEDE